MPETKQKFIEVTPFGRYPQSKSSNRCIGRLLITQRIAHGFRLESHLAASRSNDPNLRSTSYHDKPLLPQYSLQHNRVCEGPRACQRAIPTHVKLLLDKREAGPLRPLWMQLWWENRRDRSRHRQVTHHLIRTPTLEWDTRARTLDFVRSIQDKSGCQVDTRLDTARDRVEM